MERNITGFYKNYILFEQNGLFHVVNRQAQKILFKGSEEKASKIFIMLVANFINEELKIEP